MLDLYADKTNILCHEDIGKEKEDGLKRASQLEDDDIDNLHYELPLKTQMDE